MECGSRLMFGVEGYHKSGRLGSPQFCRRSNDHWTSEAPTVLKSALNYSLSLFLESIALPTVSIILLLLS